MIYTRKCLMMSNTAQWNIYHLHLTVPTNQYSSWNCLPMQSQSQYDFFATIGVSECITARNCYRASPDKNYSWENGVFVCASRSETWPASKPADNKTDGRPTCHPVFPESSTASAAVLHPSAKPVGFNGTPFDPDVSWWSMPVPGDPNADAVSANSPCRSG